MTLGETLLGGMVIAVFSGAVGKVIGSKGKVDKEDCNAKRQGCIALIGEKIDHLANEVSDLKKIINNKLLGL